MKRMLMGFIALAMLSACSLPSRIKGEAKEGPSELLGKYLSDKPFDGVAQHNVKVREENDDGTPVMRVPPRPDGGVLATLDPEGSAPKSGDIPPAVARRGGKAVEVTLDFVDAPIKDVVTVFMRDFVKKSYTFADSFKGDRKVNLYFHAKANMEEQVQMFDALLEQYGVRLRYSGGVYAIGGDERASPLPSPDRIGDGVALIRLNYLEGKDALPLVKQLVKQPDRAVQVNNMNSVLLLASNAEIRAVRQFLSEVDLPFFRGKHVLVYGPRFVSAQGLVSMIDNFQEQLGNTAVKPGRQIEARQVPEQDRVIIVAASDQARDIVLEFLASADAPSANGRQVFRLALKTQKAEQVRPKLTELIKQMMKGAAEITIVDDKDSNSLLMFATADEFAELRKLVRRIDSNPPAVHVDVAIAEVILNDTLQYGVEWYLKRIGRNIVDIKESMLSSALATSSNSMQLGGVSAGGGQQYATFQLLSSVTTFSILSNPQLIVRSGYTASIEVGGEEPTIKSKLVTSTSQGGTNLPQTEYGKETIGLKVEVTPLVGQDGSVRMTVKLEDRRVSGEKPLSDGTSQPRLTNRKITTELVSQDGSTVFLGGIRQQRGDYLANKTPGLGDIPVLGVLFKNTDQRAESTELIVLITPTVIIDQSGADMLTRAILKAMQHQALPDAKPLAAAPANDRSEDAAIR